MPVFTLGFLVSRSLFWFRGCGFPFVLTSPVFSTKSSVYTYTTVRFCFGFVVALAFAL